MMSRARPRFVGVLMLLCAVVIAGAGCASERPVMAATGAPSAPAATRPVEPPPPPPPPPLHLHLPGIGGYRGIDRGLLRGLREGGYDARLQPWDWTGSDAGLAALVATARHRAEARRIAELIAAHARDNPGGQITVSAHSGGAGIITWALEQLPPGVQIDRLVLIAPALSPQYDLSRALAHVRDRAYVFYSPYDAAVLGMGTKMFGTVDGVKVEASGKVGFAQPATPADPSQYEKLVQVPYRAEWIKLGHIGDHIGGLSRPFSRAVLAPLLARGELPAEQRVDDPLTPATPPPQPLRLPPPLPDDEPAPATIPAPGAAGR